MKIFGALFWAIPAYFLWNYLAPIYLPQIQEPYINLPYWHVAGVFVLLRIVSFIILPRRFGRHEHWGHRFNHFACRGFGRFGSRRFWKNTASVKYYHES
ncbi:MAG: hypothetical protein ACXWQQ_07685 [Pseudobdellovibrio sp.]